MGGNVTPTALGAAELEYAGDLLGALLEARWAPGGAVTRDHLWAARTLLIGRGDILRLFELRDAMGPSWEPGEHQP